MIPAQHAGTEQTNGANTVYWAVPVANKIVLKLNVVKVWVIVVDVASHVIVYTT